MTQQGISPDVFLQAEAAIAELEREVTDYKTWARDWADEVRAGAASAGDDEDAVPEMAAPAAGWVNPEAGAVGVASFWASYRPSESEAPEPAQPGHEVAAQAEPGLEPAPDSVADDAAEAYTPTAPAVQAESADGSDEVGDMQDAMKAALAAAYEELSAPDELAPAGGSVPVPESNPEATQDDSSSAPSYGDDLRAKPLPSEDEQADADPAQSARGDDLLAELDPATVRKLKMLRRLTPNASVAELLERIQGEEDAGSSPMRKKRWFGRKRP